jgi:hypothetical protein
VNYQIRYDQVSFPTGTKMWFYHNAASEIPGWSLVTAGDSLLAVKGGSTYVSGGAEAGVWQQNDHTLTLDQIPAHTHSYKVYTADSSGNLSLKTASTNRSSNNTVNTNSSGGGLGHNHGSTWRPKANVGIICQKN